MCMIIHVVQRGDSVFSISRRYGVPVQRIIDDNQLENPGLIMIGQALVIRTENIRHTVTPGQSLYRILRLYGVSVESILDANPNIDNPAQIRPGQIIIIPVGQQKLGTIEVNGYAFTNINTTTLNNTLPYLTYLSIFSHEVRPDGSLAPINDTPLISAARGQSVGPLLVITNIAEGESFDSDLARTILTDMTVQDNLVQNVINELSTGYYGLDIDFEYIYPENRQDYNNFLRRMTETLHPLGYTVSTALAPKISGDQRGLLYEAHDYEFHGQYVDHIILMTYEWGYTYSAPMAVAPIDQVRRVLDYAVTVIPPEKILMGMPNYGYDWTLPYVEGTAARSLSNVAAMNLAMNTGSEIKFDTVAMAPFFNYTDSQGRRHEVWFDDARSIQARLRLVDEYGLGGVSYWTINSFNAANWIVLSSMYDVEKVTFNQ